MWYPNTSLVEGESTHLYDTYRLVDVRESSCQTGVQDFFMYNETLFNV